MYLEKTTISKMARFCISCKEEIHPKRVEILPNVKTCVNCSTTGMKRAVQVTYGEKDHTWNDVVFLDEDQFENYQRSEKALKNLVSNSSKAEMQDFDGEIGPTDFNISE
jgi:hypothetical protein